jgi:DNA-binding NtrC family response regulator
MSQQTETQSPAALRARSKLRPALFVVLQCRRPTASPLRVRLDPGLSIELGRGDTLAAHRRGHDLVRIDVPDPVMSSKHAHVRPLLDGFVIEDAGSKNGTRVRGAAQRHAVLDDGDWIELGDTLFRFRSESVDAGDPAILQADGAELSTIVPELAARFARLATIAAVDVPILLFGETGTGKEVVARATHRLAKRSGPFVAVNCGALPETLVESELFGHRRGAFSGAGDDRAGLIRTADHGTLFLDEIGELPLPSQAALLRVLQEREVLPVGADRPVPVDLRVIGATHRSLEGAVADQTFREDLFARLAGHVVRLPALRDRMEDLGLLLGRLLPEGVRVEIEAARTLAAYTWPRNIRELEMHLTAALAADASCVRAASLPESFATTTVRDADVDRKRELEALLRQHQGNVSQVAKAMGKARSLVQKWLHRYGLDPERYRR